MASSIRKKGRSLTRSGLAELIACSDDLLMQILLCLPAKTVLRLRTLNKHWHSLISSPAFRQIHCRHSFKFSPSGLFICHPTNFRLCRSIIFDSDGHPMARSSSIFPQRYGKNIIESCNGIFLYCSGSYRNDAGANFYVINPTTKQSTLLPSPEGITKSFFALSLAFDPSLSPHYKVVHIWWSSSSLELYSEVYSSEARQWKPSNHVSLESRYNRDNSVHGVYCNGAIHWRLMNGCMNNYMNDHLVYYQVNEECLYTMELSSRHAETERITIMATIVAAIQNNLIFIDFIRDNTYQLIVFELDKDYSGFVRKYHVGMDEVLSPFPRIEHLRSRLLGAFQGPKNEDLVVTMVVDKSIVIAHHTKDNSTEVLQELQKARIRSISQRTPFVVYNYIESLCSV